MKFEKCNLKEYLDIVTKYDELENNLCLYALDVMRRKNELTPDTLEKPYYISVEDTFISEIHSEGVLVRVEEYWAYGGHETHYYHITLDELFTSTWEEDYKKRMEVALYTLKLERENKSKELELKERAELERLKEKYENKN